MISVPLAHSLSYRPSSLFVSYCVFHFYHAMSYLRRFLALLCFQVIPRFALRPFLFLFLERFYLPIFIFLSTRSFIRACSLPSHPPSLIYPFNLSVFLRLTIVHLFVVLLSFSVSRRNRFLSRATDKPFSISRCTVHLSGVA